MGQTIEHMLWYDQLKDAKDVDHSKVDSLIDYIREKMVDGNDDESFVVEIVVDGEVPVDEGGG